MIMMKTVLVAGFVAALIAPVGARSRQAPGPTPTSSAKPITLVGCIQADPAKPEWFTLADPKTGATYRLTGANVKSYVWRNVRIVGGLVPSPNIAAQRGAIDQTKVVEADQASSRPRIAAPEPLEFSVTRVRRLTGSCAPKPGQ
jgi:hypothetical protein